MLPNAQKITVTLSNVNDSDGNVTGSVPTVNGSSQLAMRMLWRCEFR